ncbi:MAG: hypothetical protein J5I91_01485 [Bacteroidetes bacterium]|nr:hypothetical protein [Bacteroidota bacterium]
MRVSVKPVLLFLILLFGLGTTLFSQTPGKKSRAQNKRLTTEPHLPVVQIDFNYAFHQPMGLLNERFTNFNGVGIGASYRWESKVLVGFNFGAMWGGGVKENNTLDSLIGPSGNLIDNNGNLAIIRLFSRGYHTDAFVGYLLNTRKKNPNSGFIFRVGAGYLEHKIKYQHTLNIMPQLENGMYKGYDRLTSGFMLTQFVGYQYSSYLKRIHFWGGIELSEGFTKNRRGFNYDTRQFDTKLRKDNLLTFRIGIMIPIYRYGRGEKEGTEIYFD